MKNTLIIHPKDESTSFLRQIYNTKKNVSVVSGNITKKDLLNRILEHDNIIMMGHGSSEGLLAVNQFDTESPYIVDSSFTDVLTRKENAIYIWCNANEFVDKFGLKGFYTGMFISEVGEAYFCGLPGTKQVEVDESNFCFSNLVSQHINCDLENMYVKVRERYGLVAEWNPIAKYNHNRIFFNS